MLEIVEISSGRRTAFSAPRKQERYENLASLFRVNSLKLMLDGERITDGFRSVNPTSLEAWEIRLTLIGQPC